MSRDIKDIGMDVQHGSGGDRCPQPQWQTGLESIVETKASSILQFIHGLRGELDVTWEERTWAGGCRSAATPGGARAVCDPRNAVPR